MKGMNQGADTVHLRPSGGSTPQASHRSVLDGRRSLQCGNLMARRNYRRGACRTNMRLPDIFNRLSWMW